MYLNISAFLVTVIISGLVLLSINLYGDQQAVGYRSSISMQSTFSQGLPLKEVDGHLVPSNR